MFLNELPLQRRRSFLRKNPLSLLFPAVIFFGLLPACKKSNGNGNGGSNAPHASFKLDGNVKSYTGSAFAELTNDNLPGSVGYQMTIVMLKSPTASTTNFAGIVLASTQPFATGKAYTADYLPGTFESQATLEYIDETGTVYTSYNVLQPSSMQATVTLTSLTTKTVKGTFAGKLFDQSMGNFTHTITEGEFTATIHE